MPRWRWILTELLSRIWFRAALIGGLSVLLALAAAGLAPLLPYELSLKIGANAADNILTILASSMLAVTTFSLTAMVTAFSGAAQLGTPRATELLVEDKTAQNALSTFLGGFLFAIVGIIALSTGLYGEQGRAILLIGTMVMIFWIVIVLLRWIATLTRFGQLGDTIRRAEKKAASALADYPGPRLLAGRTDIDVPADAKRAVSSKTGYVAYADRDSLSKLAQEAGAVIHLEAPAGHFVHPGATLAWTQRDVDLAEKRIAKRFTIRRRRDLDQDPRFGMIVLSEIASRALSPAVNDPGSAIAVLVSAQRVLDAFEKSGRGYKPLPGLVDHPLSLEEMLVDLVMPIARDGAGMFEVGIQLQKMLGALADRFEGTRTALHRMAVHALEQARRAIDAPDDLERVERAHRRAFTD